MNRTAYAIERYGNMTPGVAYPIINEGPDYYTVRVKGKPLHVSKRTVSLNAPRIREELPEYSYERFN